MTKSLKASGRRRALTIAGIVLAVVLAAVIGLLVFIGNYFYDFALNPDSPNAFSPTAEVVGSDAGTSGEAGAEDDNLWLVNSSSPAWLTSRDGLNLHAYRVDVPDTHRYAVVCHGYQSNASLTGGFARHFYDMGFTVLVPDARGHGLSEGDYIGMGWPERHDIVDWCRQIVDEDPQAEILLFGISMGGATVMMTSGEADLPANVKCIVEDCGYTSVWDEFAEQLHQLFGLPTFPILDVTSLVTQIRAGYTFREASAVDQVAKSVTPTLFIHGDADTFVPFWMLDVVYNAAACEKEKLVIPGAAHAEASSVDPELYWGTVERFVAQYIA
ncbi:alpha/beta hydrolase [uncultured Pseudoflavonifractor sp.]|uniref:alpha/beta hydrolase n=1 Tax=uncultured Pseudoflavonifractor sp. TaxID=1221379 RepID=UPI0025DF6E91|nr:alpha/beta hydrolase [uncultured Pseudoflavonifractor sp.]